MQLGALKKEVTSLNSEIAVVNSNAYMVESMAASSTYKCGRAHLTEFHKEVEEIKERAEQCFNGAQ